tara:strand:+ start:48679 stop:50553 length:1875 start_codon:yes stop_codon:yes gene_type:complete
MKLSALLLVMFMAVQFSHGQSTIESKIKSVEVYTKGAEVRRTAKLPLKNGKNEFKISNLSFNLDPKTIQISGEGFTILSVRHELDYLEKENKPDLINQLLNQSDAISDSIKYIELEINILQKEMTLLNQNQKIIGDQGIQNQDFKNAVGYFTERFKTISKQEFNLNLRKGKLNEKLMQIGLQLDSYSGQQKKPSSNIFLTISSEKSQTIPIEISYAVSEAGWFPAYDVRAKDSSQPLSITYKARVYQNTGIDWKDVKLRIASGDLESSGTAPELSPYYLGGTNFYPNRNSGIRQVHGYVISSEDGLPLPGTNVTVKGTTLGVSADNNGFYSLQVPNDNSILTFRFLGFVTQEKPVTQENINVQMMSDITELSEVVVSAYNSKRSNEASNTLAGRVPGIQIRGIGSIKDEKRSNPIPINYINYQTNFVYDIELPYSIPSTGKPEVVDMLTKEVEAEYIYSTSPKVKQTAYLVAMIKDWTDLKLLDGESNLYFENRFVGKSIIDTNVGSDTLNISLGKDEGIVINRERLKDFEERKFFSNKKKEERHFRITVMNTKSSEVSISIYDQIPITARDNVKVNVIEISGAEMNKETGLLTWKTQLKPGEKRELILKYSVEYPKEMDLEIN